MTETERTLPALDRLRDLAAPHDRTERVPVTGAAGRVLAADVEARRPVPADASAPEESNGRQVTDADGVGTGERVLPAGRRLRRTDLAFCSAAGVGRVEVWTRPTVGVVPVGKGVVAADETVETAGFRAASLVERWGGKPTYRDAVTAEFTPVRVALERDLTKDLVVATSADPSGLVTDVLRDVGEVLADGVALDPGGSVTVGRVRETPVLVLPAAPVPGFAAAVETLRPTVKRVGRVPDEGHPTVRARLDEPVAGGPDRRTVRPVALSTGESESPTAVPVEAGRGFRPLAAADGWVRLPAGRERVPAGETVTVERWEYQP